MQIGNIQLFPTDVFTFQFNFEEVKPLLDEVLSKEKEIKKISKLYSGHGGIGVYSTDFNQPVKLFEYEKLLQIVGNHFVNARHKNFLLNNYWTAFYKKGGFHGKHIHSNFINGCDHNYSSVLYLTELGGTRFLSPNPTSIYNTAHIDSKVGLLIFFPSNLLHEAKMDQEGERIIISSNVVIR